MKKIISMITVAGVVFGLSQITPVDAGAAQRQSKNIFSGMMSNFVDLDGDGFNDNALDADGDGIPNGQDSDYVKPANCTAISSGTGVGTGTCDSKGPKGSAKRGR